MGKCDRRQKVGDTQAFRDYFPLERNTECYVSALNLTKMGKFLGGD